jgi:hypothetical protein
MAIRIACLALTPVLLAGCGQSTTDTGHTVTDATESTGVVTNNAGGEQIEPMTLFEKRRLIARISEDPSQIERLTVRERRELAAMAKAVQKHHQND